MITGRLSPRWKRILLILFVALLLVGVLAAVGLYIFLQAVGGFAASMAPSRYVSELEGLEFDLGLQLPEEATDLHNVAYAFWQSRIIGVRFQIPPDKLDIFLSNLGFTGGLREGLYPFHPNSQTLAGEEWWTPDEAEEFCGASFTEPDEFFDLLVDKTNPAQYLVYLMVEQG